MANQQDWNKDMDQQRQDKDEGSFKNDPNRTSREDKKSGDVSKSKRGY